jgi:hypothetical protein
MLYLSWICAPRSRSRAAARLPALIVILVIWLAPRKASLSGCGSKPFYKAKDDALMQSGTTGSSCMSAMRKLPVVLFCRRHPHLCRRANQGL